jgi:hypothetical protein
MDRNNMSVSENCYFKDSGHGGGYISGLPLPRTGGKTGRIMSHRFEDCVFHPCCKGPFIDCVFVRCDGPDKTECTDCIFEDEQNSF